MTTARDTLNATLPNQWAAPCGLNTRTCGFRWLPLVAVLAFAHAGGALAAPVLHLAIATHSEDQPNYSANKALYTSNRNALIAFARLMAERGLPWNWQCDWSFLNAAYTNEVFAPDPRLLAATSNTNIVAWLRYVMGVETDPHSHENGGYNYADVAYLFTRMGVEPSGVVGGHIYDPAYAGYANWPKFLGAGLRGQRYTNYVWRPRLLMGGGTPNHIADPVATGIWLPACTNDYLGHSPTGAIAAWGMWGEDRFPELLDIIASNALPTNRMWTAGFTFGQGQLSTGSGYLTNVLIPMIDMIAALRDAGRIRVVQYEEGMNIWTNEFGAVGTNYQAPADTLTFSLNVQDFSYPDRSAEVIDRAVTLHESVGVPVDVFLTTTMVDMYQSNYPALFTRLLTSPVVALSYHTRPPKPYHNGYSNLTSLTSNQVYDLVTNYETHELDLITGQPTTNPGGYVKLRGLAGYAPFIVAALTTAPLKGPVHTAFNKLGARVAVVHGRAVNFTNRLVYGMYEKPEHVDLRLFETNYDGVAPSVILSNAFTWARASNNVVPPYFVGVKMHDNDFFAQDSAWVTVYQNGPHVPPWTNAYTLKSPLLTTNEMTNMWNRYEAMVRYVGSNTMRYTGLNARGILSRLGVGPAWPLLSPARLAEGASEGTVARRFSAVTNRYAANTNVGWQFVSGPGDCHNSEFTLSNGVLRAATVFDHETQPARFVRVRGFDTNSVWTEQYFAVIVTNILSDDDDGDGHTEAQELAAGTNPLDANSALRLQPGSGVGPTVVLSWAAVPGRGYLVQSATSVLGPWLDLPSTATNAASARVELTVPLGPGEAVFYRIKLTGP
jgi:hypothetical protein